MFCSNCGNEIEEGASKCSKCGESTNKKSTPVKKEKTEVCPLSVVSLVLAGISLIFGFVLVTCSLATGFGMVSSDGLVALPAVTSICIAVFHLVKSKSGKALSFISIGVSAFVLFYTLIGYIVMYA